jgi:RNA polymerase sigma factor (sigma-70 family)
MGQHRLATPDLGRIFRGEAVLGLSEWQLLERYLERRDEGAFEALVSRHGPMVLGVCRRMLADRTDAEDAFQATFLVLVRRARHLGPRDAIGPWLYGVATRVAMRSRSEAARRRRFQPMTSETATVLDDRSVDNREIGEVLDQELSRLPAKYRHPIVLCYLEGQTHEEAARLLKWPIGTVKGRLARARDLLQSRLVRRGLTPAVGALSLALSPDSWAAPHRELLDRTVKSSLKLALGGTTAQVVSMSITTLVEGVMASMFLNTLKWAGMAALVCGLAFTGVGVMARQDAEAKKEEAPPALKTLTEPAEPKISAAKMPPKDVEAPNTDGTDVAAKLPGLKRELLKAANIEWELAYLDYIAKNTGLDEAYQASKRLLVAHEACVTVPDEKSTAAKAHLQRIRGLARAQHQHSPSSEISEAHIKAYAAEAEVLVAQAETSSSSKEEEKEPSRGPAIKGGRANDVKSQLILAKLDEPISMSFSEETPLEDVLKYIKQASTTKTYAGIPIYVDPVGLQEAEKSMTSTVRGMDLEGVPLRRTLQLLLKQLDLVYFVEDGMLYITSSESENRWGELGPAMSEPSPILQRAGKAERGELSLLEMQDLVELFKTRDQIIKLAGGGGHGLDVDQSNKEKEELKQNRELTEQLLKEMRELVQLLKAEKQTKNAAQSK